MSQKASVTVGKSHRRQVSAASESTRLMAIGLVFCLVAFLIWHFDDKQTIGDGFGIGERNERRDEESEKEKDDLLARGLNEGDR